MDSTCNRLINRSHSIRDQYAPVIIELSQEDAQQFVPTEVFGRTLFNIDRPHRAEEERSTDQPW